MEGNDSTTTPHSVYLDVHERVDDDGDEEVEEDEDHEDDVEEPEDERSHVGPPVEVDDGVEDIVVVDEHHEAREHGPHKSGELGRGIE